MSSQFFAESVSARFPAGENERDVETTPDVELADGESATASNRKFSTVGRTLKFKGDLHAEEDLLIQGRIEGSVTHTGSNLTIGAHGHVEANISGKKIIVQGHLSGDVHATESVVVEASAHVTGNLFAPSVGIKEGAKFKGRIDMDVAAASNASAETGARKNAPQRARKGREEKGKDGDPMVDSGVSALLA
jgi:cytoskeletal protein CcmA (bactofilin family)